MSRSIHLATEDELPAMHAILSYIFHVKEF